METIFNLIREFRQCNFAMVDGNTVKDRILNEIEVRMVIAIKDLYSLIAVKDSYKKKLDEIQKLVDAQAVDEGLWFVAQTAPEAYLQDALRLLHGMIEYHPPSRFPGICDSVETKEER